MSKMHQAGDVRQIISPISHLPIDPASIFPIHSNINSTMASAVFDQETLNTAITAGVVECDDTMMTSEETVNRNQNFLSSLPVETRLEIERAIARSGVEGSEITVVVEEPTLLEHNIQFDNSQTDTREPEPYTVQVHLPGMQPTAYQNESPSQHSATVEHQVYDIKLEADKESVASTGKNMSFAQVSSLHDFTENQVPITSVPSQWNQASVQRLLELIKEHQKLFCDGKSKKKQLWGTISKKLAMEGVHFSPARVAWKWKSMMREYNNVVEHNGKHGHWAKKTCPFYNEMAKVLDTDRVDVSGPESASSPQASSVEGVDILQLASYQIFQPNEKSLEKLHTHSFLPKSNVIEKAADDKVHDNSSTKVELNSEGLSEFSQVLAAVKTLQEEQRDAERRQARAQERMHEEQMIVLRETLSLLKELRDMINGSNTDRARLDSKGPESQLKIQEQSETLEVAAPSQMIIDKAKECQKEAQAFLKHSNIKLNDLLDGDHQREAYKKAAEDNKGEEIQMSSPTYTVLHDGKSKNCERNSPSQDAQTCQSYPSNGKFMYDICDKNLTTKTNLQHSVLAHGADTQYRCDMCNKVFRVKANIRSHMKVHLANSCYICDVCGLTFKTARILRRHKHIHKGHHPHKCPSCGKGFHRTDELKVHMIVHSDDCAARCGVCGKGFKQKFNLKRHMATHTSPRVYHHLCSICDKGFPDRTHLKEHYLTHTKEKPYACEVCSKDFTSSNLLSRHQRNHWPQKPCLCDVCGNDFTTWTHVKRHKQRIHGKE